MLELATKRERWFRRGCRPHVIFAIQDSWLRGQIRISEQTSAMTEHVQQRHASIGNRVSHPKIGEVFVRRIIERKQTLVLTQCDCHRGERLGTGAYWECGIGSDRKSLFEITLAQHLCVHHSVVLNDRER